MAIRISEVRSSTLSGDKRELLVAVTGKYTGELELRFARECLGQLLQMLTEAEEALNPSVKATRPTAVAMPPVAPSEADAEPGQSAKPDEVRFQIPKNIAVTADNSGRGLVLMIVNHRMENQNGYALSPDSAKQIAGGLVKSADAALALRQSAPRPNP